MALSGFILKEQSDFKMRALRDLEVLTPYPGEVSPQAERTKFPKNNSVFVALS